MDEEGQLETAANPSLLAGHTLLGPQHLAPSGSGKPGGPAPRQHRAAIQTASVCRLWQLGAADLEASLRSRPTELQALRQGLDMRRQGPRPWCGTG